jgi:hypothetical protein
VKELREFRDWDVGRLVDVFTCVEVVWHERLSLLG